MRHVIWLLIAVTAILPVSALFAAEAPLPADKAVQAKLPSFVFTGGGDQALAQVAKVSGVRIELDQAGLEQAGVKLNAPVSVKLANASVATILDVIVGQLAPKDVPLAWQTAGPAVQISTQQRIMRYRSSTSGSGGQYAPLPPSAGQPAPSSAPLAPSTPRSPTMGEMSFQNTPLADFLTFVQSVARINMHVNWEALKISNVDRTTPVSLAASNITMGRALDLVLGDINAGKGKMDSIYWVVDGGILLISTGTALDSEMRTRTQDVADLLMVVRNFPGRSLALGGNTSGNTGGGGNGTAWANNNSDTNTNPNTPSATEAKEQAKKALISVIQSSTGPEFWQPQGKGSIQFLGNTMIISQSLLGFKLMDQAAR